MLDASTEVHNVASELGFNLDSTDESSSDVTETESTDADGEVNGEELNAESELEGDQEAQSVTEEEDKTPPTDVVEPEQKLTLKEFQEIEAAKQSLATERQAFMEEKARMETEFQEKYHEKVKTHDQMDEFLAHLASKDPEIFEIIKGEFAEHQKQYTNPVYNSLKSEMEALKKELGSFKNTASDEVTRTKLDSEMDKVKSTLGKEAEASGLKVDWAKVEDVWADNPKLTVEQAFYALHGQSLMKTTASKAKVAEVTKKVQGRPAVNTAGSVSKAATPINSAIPKDALGAAHYFAKQLTGKTY